MPDTDKMLNAAQAAAELGVTESRLRGMVHRGELNGLKYPPDKPRRGILLFDPEEVARVKAEREALRAAKAGKPGRPIKSPRGKE